MKRNERISWNATGEFSFHSMTYEQNLMFVFFAPHSVAALKCRQRKKQWLANLQTKVEIYSSENDALSSTVTQLREEIVNLKTLLLAHKDCPVSQAQGLGGLMVNGIPGDFNPHPNPYAMTMQPGAPGIPTQGMSRR